MNRVQLVVTGECERKALHTSLGRLFPQADFSVPVKVHSFTSTPLGGPSPAGVLSTLDKFAAKLVELVDEDDEVHVVGVDDLELGQDPAITAREVGAAVTRVLQNLGLSQARRNRLATALSTQCSFHILSPMLEAYFFGESAALARAGAVLPSRFNPQTVNLEEFIVVDASFTGPVDDPESDWKRAGNQRARHPKLYLRYLQGPEGYYRETVHGVAALKSLDWAAVLTIANFTTLARAAISDIADGQGLNNPAPGTEHVATSIGTHRLSRTLRNL